MKKTYIAPILLSSGEAVHETLQSDQSGQPEAVAPLIYKPGVGGGLGFYL